MCDYCDGVCKCDAGWVDAEPSTSDLKAIENDVFVDTLDPILTDLDTDD